MCYTVKQSMRIEKHFSNQLERHLFGLASPVLFRTFFKSITVLLILVPIALLIGTQRGDALRVGLIAYGILLGTTGALAYGIARIALLFRSYRERERTFLESMGEGVCAMDTHRNIILWNHALEILSGLKKERAIGRAFDDWFEPENTASKKALPDDALSKPRRNHEDHRAFLKTTAGKRIPIAGAATPLRDEYGMASGCVFVFRDVTKEREIERAKDEFVSFASHQLRTPLTNMMWRVEMLLDGDAGKLTRQQRIFLREIEDGNRRMAQLVNVFLNVSRLNLGTLAITPEHVDIVRCIDELVREIEPLAHEKNVRLRTAYDTGLATMNCDPKILRIIVQNLLSNAVRYTPNGGTVILRTQGSGQELLIAVSDTGIGIPKKQQAKIFTKLFRADNVKKQHPDGTGLGLYLVKSLARTCGGRVWFESQENHGSTFCVALPVVGGHGRKGNRSLIESAPISTYA